MTDLITNPLDPAQKVLPGMVEVAAWMASMDEDVFSHLLHHDPTALIESDVALANLEDRERLVRAYLSALASGQLVRTRWPQKGQYASLCFPGMGDVLARFITDKALGKDPRDTAIDLAVACRLQELGGILATVALDATEPEVIRRSAAWAASDIGDEHTRQRLKPLIAGPADEDPFEELKGCAMRANWPDSLSIHELAERLTAPRWYGIGAYRLFLSQSFVQGLKDDDLLPALQWLGEQAHWEERAQYELDEIEARLISRALEKFDDPEIGDWVLRRAISNLTEYKPMFGETTRSGKADELLSSSELRQALIQGLSRHLSDPERINTLSFMISEHLRHHPAWVAEDYSWMAQQLKETKPGSSSEVFWLRLLKGMFYVSNPEHTSVLYELYLNPRFSVQLADWFAPVDVRSSDAARQKESWYIATGHQQHDREPAKPPMDIEAYIVAILDRLEGGQPMGWWQVVEWLKTDDRAVRHEAPWITDVTELPGWQLCSPLTQRRIEDTALSFLQAHTPRYDHIGTSTYYPDNLAAYRALVLLARTRPSELNSLSPEMWLQLGPLVLGMYPEASGEETPYQVGFLERAIKSGFDPTPWLATIASRAEEGSSFYLSPALRAVVELLSPDRLEQLAARLIRSDMPMSALLESTRALSGQGVQSAFPRTLEVIKHYSEDLATVDQAARLSASLMEFVDRKTWQKLWALLENDDDLFERTFLAYTHWHHEAAEITRVMDERTLARLYQRLAERFPSSEDPDIGEWHEVSPRESLGHWRERLLTSLTMRGTWEAVEELRGLASTLPDIDWLRVRVAQAEEEARRQTWQPPSTEELLVMIKENGSRIIRSAGQLHDVLLESLERLQTALLAESPAAVDLWNIRGTDKIGKPKDELLISDYIKRHLDRDLHHLGVTAHREVENRPGNEIDLYVHYRDTASSSPITVVCEAKGCWHRDLYTNMTSQLYERYMKQQGLSHGIYVVAFFDGDRWDPADHASRHQARRHSLSELEADMVDQASQLTEDVFHVTAVVLDCNY